VSLITEEKQQRSPLIDPLRQIFSSRSGILILTAVLVTVLKVGLLAIGVNIEPIEAEINSIVGLLFAGAVGYKAEDYIRYSRENYAKLPTDDNELLKQFGFQFVTGLFSDNNGLSNEQVETVKEKFNETISKMDSAS